MSTITHECLADALSAAQGEFPHILKNKVATTPKFTYAYADISDVIAAVAPVLSRHGLCQLQRLAVSDGQQLLVTELRHKAEVVSSEMILPIAGLDPQGVGRVLTYARRYALQSLLGVAAERDDDAADTGEVRQPAAKPAPEPEPAPHPMFANLLEQALGASSSADLAALAPRVRDAWPDLIVSDRHTAGRIKALMRDKAAEFGLDLSTV